jgi:hypothetical protein
MNSLQTIVVRLIYALAGGLACYAIAAAVARTTTHLVEGLASIGP